MGYDPFERGPLPVGVRTTRFVDQSRGRRELETEIWYPATDAFAGRDLDDASCDHYALMPGLTESRQLAVRDAEPRDGSFPLVAFSHGYGGHRRQSTFLCTHLASHGYVVVAPDHAGNTAAELIQGALHAMIGERHPPLPISELMALRPVDLSFAIDRAIAEQPGVDAERIAACGHSFGGWTTLAVAGRDERVRAALPLAPAGGMSTGALEGDDLLFSALDFGWSREVPTLFVVAERDSLLPLDSMRPLYDAVASPKQLVVIRDADHMHFCDDAEMVHELFRVLPPAEGVPQGAFPAFDELCAADHGYHTVRALGLAHMDAHVRDIGAARDFFADGWRAALAERGVGIDVW